MDVAAPHRRRRPVLRVRPARKRDPEVRNLSWRLGAPRRRKPHLIQLRTGFRCRNILQVWDSHPQLPSHAANVGYRARIALCIGMSAKQPLHPRRHLQTAAATKTSGSSYLQASGALRRLDLATVTARSGARLRLGVASLGRGAAAPAQLSEVSAGLARAAFGRWLPIQPRCVRILWITGRPKLATMSPLSRRPHRPCTTRSSPPRASESGSFR